MGLFFVSVHFGRRLSAAGRRSRRVSPSLAACTATRPGASMPDEVVMIPSLSRGLRLALILSLGAIGGAWPLHDQVAYAQDEDEEEEDSEEEETEEEGEEEESDQPPVTAGGLFTLKTYPVREIARPLTMTQGITQLRVGFGVDISAQGAFESVGAKLEGEYGLQDHFTLLGGLTGQYNFKQFQVYAGIEGALSYDLINFRLAAILQRAAIPPMAVGDPPMVPEDAEIEAGDVKAGIDIGFPFRYAAKPEIAIIALDTLMTVDFDSKPDLKPSLGISTNPIEPVSIVVFAQLVIPDFNTDAENFLVPATARVQFSPSQKLDLGAEFVFLNLKPPESSGKEFYDDRFLTLFAAFRM